MDDFNATDSERYQTVMKWLRSVFDDEPIPSFSREVELIDHLYQLMSSHMQLSTKTESYNEFVKASIRDHHADLVLVKSLLKSAGVPSTNSSESLSAEKLTSIASTLSLSDVAESSYILALSELFLQIDKTTSQVNTLTEQIKMGRNELVDSVQLGAQLESMVNALSENRSAEKQQLQSHAKEAEFLLQKVTKYKSDKRKQEEMLAKSGVNNSLTHERLLKDHHQLTDLMSKLQSTEEELQMFSDLPPDRDLARVRLEVAKTELQRIEDQLAKQIDMFHL